MWRRFLRSSSLKVWKSLTGALCLQGLRMPYRLRCILVSLELLFSAARELVELVGWSVDEIRRRYCNFFRTLHAHLTIESVSVSVSAYSCATQCDGRHVSLAIISCTSFDMCLCQRNSSASSSDRDSVCWPMASRVGAGSHTQANAAQWTWIRCQYRGGDSQLVERPWTTAVRVFASSRRLAGMDPLHSM
jgi:hypothetical protein